MKGIIGIFRKSDGKCMHIDYSNNSDIFTKKDEYYIEPIEIWGPKYIEILGDINQDDLIKRKNSYIKTWKPLDEDNNDER